MIFPRCTTVKTLHETKLLRADDLYTDWGITWMGDCTQWLAACVSNHCV